MTHEVNSPVSLKLLLTRLIDAPREKLFRAWTDPALIVQWFTPAPWKTLCAEVDLRPGGSSLRESPCGKASPSSIGDEIAEGAVQLLAIAAQLGPLATDGEPVTALAETLPKDRKSNGTIESIWSI